MSRELYIVLVVLVVNFTYGIDMLQAVTECPNCKSPMSPFFLEYNKIPLHFGLTLCTVCRIVNLDDQTIDEINRRISLEKTNGGNRKNGT